MSKIIDITQQLLGKEATELLRNDEIFQGLLTMEPHQIKGVGYIFVIMMLMQIEIMQDYICSLAREIANLKGEVFGPQERQKLEEYLDFDIEKTLQAIKRRVKGE